MAGTIGTELFMVQLKHVRNEKYQESSIELHPDRNINNLNGIVSKNGQYKFLTTPSGYKWDINHIDRNQAILLEVLKGFRYYGWRLLTSHAFNSSSGIELVVETDYIFEINVDDYFHVLDTLFGDTNGSQIHSNGVDYSKYAVYETKSSDQRISNTPTAAGARRPSDSNTLNKDFHHEPHNHALAHHESPSSRSGKTKGPASAEYAAMLLDTTVTPQAGPYGFTRLHNIQTNNVMTPKARMEKKEAALAEAQSKKLTSPSISSAVSPVAAQQTPDVEKVRMSISSPEHTTQSSVVQSPAVQHHQPNILLEVVSSTPRSSIRRVSNGVTFAENTAAGPESSVHTQPAVALSPVVEAEETREISHKPVDISPIVAPIVMVSEVPETSAFRAPPVIRAAPPVPTRATNTAEAELTGQTTPTRDSIAENVASDRTVASQAVEVVHLETSTGSAAESDAALAPAVSSVEVAGVTSPDSSASSSSGALRRPSTNSSSAADKLFQKYSHRKSFTNGSKSPAASFSSPDTAATALPANSGTGSTTQSEPIAAKVSLSIVTGSEPSAEPAKPATSAAANKLFQKYNQHKKPSGAHSQSSNKLVVAPESAAPQATTTEAPKVEAKVEIKNDSVVAPSATPVASTPPQPRKSLSNLFGGLPTEQTVPEEVVVGHLSAEVVESPKPAAAVLPDTMLVHHSQLQAEGRGEVRRSIGGFRRVKSIISVSKDEEEDYGDVSNIKVIENGTEQDAAVLSVVTKADPTPDPIGASRTASASPSHDKPPLIPAPVPRKSFIGMLQKTKTPNLNVDPFASDQLRRSGDDEDYGDLSRIQTIELGDDDEDSGLDMSTKTGSAKSDKRSPMHIATNGIAAPVSPLVSPVEKKLLSTPSMFVSPDAMELLRKPVDNSTDEEKAASAIHENSRTNHYAKLGSAFVSEKILSAGRGGRGRGAGRGGGIR